MWLCVRGVFFFSSRRRHTRWTGDWSSDVCSSDLGGGIAVLDVPTCWRLVGGEEVGRLAVSVDRRPDIFPVNYAVDEATIVFRTAEGTKLSAVFVDSAVAFEVDGYDAATGTAWSVVIKGHAAEVPMHELLDDLAFPL